MQWTALDPAWAVPNAPCDFDTDALWASSGAASIASPMASTPHDLIMEIGRLTRYLDSRGAGVATLVGAGGVGVLTERAAYGLVERAGEISSGGATRLLCAADGWVAVSLARPDDLDLLPAWIGVESGDDHWAAVAPAVAARSTAELVESATLLGLAVSAVGETADRRGVFVRRVGDAPGRRGALDGVIIANLASLWAGPLAADVLSRLGARVLTVESVHRPDGSRATPSFFEALHGRTESVALDFRSSLGRRQLAQLLASVDAVIEGSRPRALEQLGIDAFELTRRGPRVWASITAHGRSGPCAQRVGYGDDAAAAGGLVGWVDQRPVFLGDATADPLTGLTTAATIVQLLTAGGRWIVDSALARIASSVAPSPGSRTSPEMSHSMRVPRTRRDRGRPLPLGRDTALVLAEFGIECQGSAGSARWRTVELPGRGQQNCPVVASSSARWFRWSVVSPPCRRWLG